MSALLQAASSPRVNGPPKEACLVSQSVLTEMITGVESPDDTPNLEV
jgi:hypothetical protein